jgi:hypothetical protein
LLDGQNLDSLATRLAVTDVTAGITHLFLPQRQAASGTYNNGPASPLPNAESSDAAASAMRIVRWVQRRAATALNGSERATVL